MTELIYPAIRLVYYSGLTNFTPYAVTAFIFVGLDAHLRGSPDRDRNRVAEAVRHLMRSRLFLALVTVGTVLNLSHGLYKGYVVPRDFMQDVFSARGFMTGQSLYPSDMTAKFVGEVKSHPPRFSIWPANSDGRRDEQEAREDAADSDWVQAHPPCMSLLFVPFVALFGTYGTYFAVAAVSVVSLLAALALIVRTLGLKPNPVEAATVTLLVLGWGPTVEALRLGQSGLYLLLLVVIGWVCLRNGRPRLAGVALGLATCLKVYPGILLVYLLLRHRRAFYSAAATVAVLLGGTLLLCGPGVYAAYGKTAIYVTNLYASYEANVSFLGFVVGALDDPRRLVLAKGLAALIGLAFTLGAGRVVMSLRPAGPAEGTTLDAEYALFLSLAPLLVPVAWEHYLVILILPLAILGVAIFKTGDGGSALGYLALLETLAFPFLTFVVVGLALKGFAFGRYADLVLLKSRTFAMVWVSVWLALQLVRTSLLTRLETSRSRLHAEGV